VCRGIAVICAIMLILVDLVMPSASGVAKPKVLVLYNAYMAFNDRLYGVFVVCFLNMLMWDISPLRFCHIRSRLNLSDWLDYERYKLVVFLGCRK